MTATKWREGKLTYLRPLELADAAIAYCGINHPDNQRFLARTDPAGLGFEEDWIKSKQKPNATDLTVAICLQETDELIGTMGLHQIDQQNGTATTGATIYFDQHRGHGYGTDAKMVLLDYAFNWRNLRLIESRVIAFNGRSVRYSEKCGYKIETRLRQRHFRFGEYHDEVILSVTREEWLPLWEQHNAD